MRLSRRPSQPVYRPGDALRSASCNPRERRSEPLRPSPRILNFPMMMRILGTILAALLGLAFGSFLNVCLSRWPEGESVVKPRSHCRNCERTLAWSENIPLLSWLALRGRCRTCGAKISWRYPLVESVVGALWAVIVWQQISSVGSSLSSSPFPETVSSALFSSRSFWEQYSGRWCSP